MSRNTQLDSLLEEIERTPVPEIIVRQSAVFDAMRRGESEFVLFGAARMGSMCFDWLTKHGFKVICFTDNNRDLWTKHEGLDVLPPDEAIVRHGQHAAFLVTSYNTAAIRKQLADAGVRTVIPYNALFWHDTQWFRDLNIHGQHRIDAPVHLKSALPEIRRCASELHDDDSRVEMYKQLGWRWTMDNRLYACPLDIKDIYFPEFIKLSDEEVYVDCGAFTGDTIAEFVKRRPKHKAILAFEPDPRNQNCLHEWLSAHNGDALVFPYALSNVTERSKFLVRGDGTSRIAVKEDGMAIQKMRMDDLALPYQPTFIKMDIEGEEPRAIAGAAETIRKARPALAICVYHQGDHLWKIPNLIHEIVPDYATFIRRYMEECSESVCYGVPKERLA